MVLKYSFILLMICTGLFSSEKPIDVIAFGSCANQNKEQPSWKSISKHKPDLMIMLGDNVYADVDDSWIKQANENKRTTELELKVTKHIQTQYRKLSNNKDFMQLRTNTPFIATWDDHDFGKNDMGKEFPFKAISKDIFLNFWEEDKTSPRKSQDDGIYASYYYGEMGKKVQVILLDSRYMRDSQFLVDKANEIQRAKNNRGPYLANPDPMIRMLGDKQWKWLENELEKPADLRIIGCSIQFLSDFTGWESWSNFPKERERLVKLIEQKKSEHVVFISGDTHWSEFSKLDENVPYPLWELTSSGINMEWREVSPNRNRVGEPYYKSNFGLILIDWENNPTVTMQIRNEDNTLIMEKKIELSTLTFKQ